MDNTENVLAQLKQFITLFQAAVASIEGTYEAKVAVIVDERIKDKDKTITQLESEKQTLATQIENLTTENESLKIEPAELINE